VDVVHDEEIEICPGTPLHGEVDVHLTTAGSSTSRRPSQGASKNPFSSEELLWKFRTLAGKASTTRTVLTDHRGRPSMKTWKDSTN
jgi:hypothetical protein